MPRPFERRAAGKTTYYKLAYWCDRKQCWTDTSKQYDLLGDLIPAARKLGPGRYRVSRVTDGQPRQDLHEFTVGEPELGL